MTPLRSVRMMSDLVSTLILCCFILRIDIVGGHQSHPFLSLAWVEEANLMIVTSFLNTERSSIYFFTFYMGLLLFVLDCLGVLRLVWLLRDLLGILALRWLALQLNVVKGGWS